MAHGYFKLQHVHGISGLGSILFDYPTVLQHHISPTWHLLYLCPMSIVHSWLSSSPRLLLLLLENIYSWSPASTSVPRQQLLFPDQSFYSWIIASIPFNKLYSQIKSFSSGIKTDISVHEIIFLHMSF